MVPPKLMGMFDIIKDALFCPFCGKQQEECEFQSKDVGEMMNAWTIEKIKKFFPKSSKLEIHSQCTYCKEWISINLDLWRMKDGMLS